MLRRSVRHTRYVRKLGDSQLTGLAIRKMSDFWRGTCTSGSRTSTRESTCSMVTGKTILIAVDRFIGRLFLIFAALFVGMAILALPPEGFFFALPILLFLAALFLGMIGGLFFIAVKGLRQRAPWQWPAQVAPILVIVCIILLLLIS